MAFVRRKTSRGREAYYLVESRRENGHVRQRVIAYLGPCATVDEAIIHWTEEARKWRERFAARQAHASQPRWSRRHRRMVSGDGASSPFVETARKWAERAERRVEMLTRWRSAQHREYGKTLSGTTIRTGRRQGGLKSVDVGTLSGTTVGNARRGEGVQ